MKRIIYASLVSVPLACVVQGYWAADPFMVLIGLTVTVAWAAGLTAGVGNPTAKPVCPSCGRPRAECRAALEMVGDNIPDPVVEDDLPDPADVTDRVVRLDEDYVVIRRRNNSIVARPTTGLESRIGFPIFRNAVLAGTSTPPSERVTSAISKAADDGRAFVLGSTFNYWTGTRWIVWDARSNAA